MLNAIKNSKQNLHESKELKAMRKIIVFYTVFGLLVLIVLIKACAVNVYANELPIMEDMPVHVPHDVHIDIEGLNNMWGMPFSVARNFVYMQIRASERRKRENYTVESWEVLDRRLDSAILVLNRPAPEEELWSVANHLVDARDRLVPVESEIEQLRGMQEIYTHWSLALKGMIIALLIVQIFSQVWGKRA